MSCVVDESVNVCLSFVLQASRPGSACLNSQGAFPREITLASKFATVSQSLVVWSKSKITQARFFNFFLVIMCVELIYE